MEEIKDIVQSVVKGCGQGGVEVSEILAAFVARTVVESDVAAFALDRSITPEKKQEVILQSIERLLERDSPALEMIKMQVDFDSTYLEEELESQRKIKARNKMIAGHKQAILEVKMEDAQDYEALTTLYRKVFRFLLEFAPNSKAADKIVEREIAAALESVFPRVGLKSFIQLGTEEKVVQLLELARIILGIRLFNREEGRGGVGIDNLDKDGNLLSKMLLQDIEKEIEFFNDACHKYQQAIVKAYSYRRKKKFLNDEIENKKREADESGTTAVAGDTGAKQSQHASHRHGLKNELFLISQIEDVNDYVIERWSQELANRRQYLGFLNSVFDEMKFIHTKVSSITEKLKLELSTVKSLVNNKASVPKEVIYPKFDGLGTLWLQLYEEIVVMIARSNTFQVLCKYRLSFSPTLANELIGDEAVNNEYEISMKEAQQKQSTKKEEFYEKDGSQKGDYDDDMKGFMEDEQLDSLKIAPTAESKNIDEERLPEFAESGAQLLSVENTPDFSLLPLSLQGYCPWTMVESNGLLIPGKPGLGIVRFENQYYVFDHALGIKSFMLNPQHYLTSIRNRALRSPEYIHLLRLQKWFPTVAISKLLQNQENVEINNHTGQPFTKDAATETPLHFTESYIDLNYHWNEWELRRRALKIVNLKNCRTKGQQTDASHFRRENETQVYLPREDSTQSKRDKGTNPPIVTTYAQGLRGRVVVAEEKESLVKHKRTESKHENKDGQIEKEFKPRKITYPKVGVVKLTLDL